MSKHNNNVLEDLTSLSQLEGDQVLRDVHSYPGHYLRVRDANTVIDENFDTYKVTYNGSGDPTEVCYFKGTSSHVTQIAFVSDVSSSLNNKYFLIYSAKTGVTYHVWYNVDGAGVDPAPSGSVGIEIPITENETAAIVAYATQLVFNSLLKTSFNTTRANAVLTITNSVFGEIQDTIDIDTSFLINNIQGTDELIEKVNIDYDGDGNPIYKGVTLKGYTYNIVTGQFELTSLDEVQSKNYSIQYNEITSIASGINSVIDTFTATKDNTCIKNIFVSGCNIGEYTLELNSNVIDKKLTYFGGSLNEKFSFEGNDGLVLNNGDILEVKVIHSRPQVGNFNSRIDILETP